MNKFKSLWPGYPTFIVFILLLTFAGVCIFLPQDLLDPIIAAPSSNVISEGKKILDVTFPEPEVIDLEALFISMWDFKMNQICPEGNLCKRNPIDVPPYCPKCQKPTVRWSGWATCTLIAAPAYYDEQNKYHLDDPNICTENLRCAVCRIEYSWSYKKSER